MNQFILRKAPAASAALVLAGMAPGELLAADPPAAIAPAAPSLAASMQAFFRSF